MQGREGTLLPWAPWSFPKCYFSLTCVRQSLVPDSDFSFPVVYTRHTWKAIKLFNTWTIYRAISKYKKCIPGTGKFYGLSLKNGLEAGPAPPPTSASPKAKVSINVLWQQFYYFIFCGTGLHYPRVVFKINSWRVWVEVNGPTFHNSSVSFVSTLILAFSLNIVALARFSAMGK